MAKTEFYPPTRKITKLIGLGASTMAGEGATDRKRGWFDLLVSRFYDAYDDPTENTHPVSHVNLAETGGLASTYADSMDSLVALFHRAPRGGRALWIVQLGDNDTYVRYGDGRPRTTKEQYAASIKRITQTALQAGGVVLNLGLSPVNYRKMREVYPWPTYDDPTYNALCFEEAGGLAAQEAGRELGRPEDVYVENTYIPTLNAMRQQRFEYAPDGLHPSDRGHRYLASTHWDIVDDIIRASGNIPNPNVIR